MARGATIIKLGNVAMPYQESLRWPKYRGTIARPVEFVCPASFYPQLLALAQSLGTGTTELTITGPSGPGATPSDNTVVIEGIYIDRVVQVSDTICKVILYDRRFLLSRFVCGRDFNVRFGDGYLNDTEFAQWQLVLRDLMDDRSQISAAFDALVNPVTFKAPDGVHLAGMTYAHALGDALERAGMSLTVTNAGRFRLVDMGDASDVGRLPSKAAYGWSIEPGWAYNDAYICGKPVRVNCHYWERHCIRLQGSDPNSTIAHSGPEELRVELEQVYKCKDEDDKPVYLTLEDMLEAQGFSRAAITDAQIADHYMSDTFEGTDLYSEIENDATKRVIDAIHECWRRLWRVKFVGANGAIGGWTDWAFGKINEDGSTQSVVVECPWVEFLNAPAPTGGGDSATFIGQATTINHASPAPFTATWEGGDPATGIIRLVQDVLPDQNFAVPGALTEALTIKEVTKLEDGQGNSYGEELKEIYGFVESESRSKARFTKTFTIAVYVCATRRMPNDLSRFHVESARGFDDGTVGYIELPVSGELLCVRDYVNANETDKGAESDGLGRILNADPLKEDAKARVEAWKGAYASSVDGEGLAESVALFKDFEVSGAIAELVLELDEEVIRTRIITGDLSDIEAKLRRERKRLADRKFATAGAA